MSERDGLLRAIHENPDDDAPRGAYADWLDEHGDPDWAELMRLHVAASNHGEKLRPDQQPRLKVLERLCGDRLRARLRNVPRVTYKLARGIPVAIADSPTAAEAFLRKRRRAEVTGLWLRRSGGINRLAYRPRLKSIHYLSLAGCRVNQGNSGVVLVTSPNLTGLVRLDLASTRADGEFVLTAARNPALAGLRALSLAFNLRLAVADLVGKLLAARPALVELDLSRTNPSTAVLTAWAAEPALTQLKFLELNDNRLGDAGAAALAASPYLAGLWRLELRGNKITAAGAEALGRSPYLGAVEVLDLQHNPIPPAAAAVLRARFGKNVRLDS